MRLAALFAPTDGKRAHPGADLARVVATLCVGVALYLAADTLLLVVRTYCELPFWDEWGIVWEYHLLRSGEYGLAQFFGQHNEHRIALSRLLYLADYSLAGGKNQINLAVIAIAQAIHAGLLISLLGAFRERVSSWITAAAVVGLMFSLGQWQNFVWGFQTQFVGVFALATGAFMLLASACREGLPSSRARRRFAGALILLLAATFSMANGVVATGIGLALCLAMRAPRWMSLCLGLFLIALATAYFHGYHPAAGNSTASYALTHPLEYVRYTLSYLGNPFGDLRLTRPTSPIASLAPTALGTVGLIAGLAAVAVVAADRGRNWRQAALAAVILFVFAAAALTALGRLNFGLDQAYSSRYRTPGGILWAALVVFWVLQARAWPRWKDALLAAVVAAPMLGVMVWVQEVSRPAVLKQAAETRLARDALLSGVHDEGILTTVLPGRPDVVERTPILRRYGKSLYAWPEAYWIGRRLGEVTTLRPKRCMGFFDAVARPRASGVDTVLVRGWAIDRKTDTPAKRILLTNKQGHIVGFASPGMPRPDVVSALNEQGAAQSGWEGVARASGGELHAFALLPGAVACPVGMHATAGLTPVLGYSYVRRRSIGAPLTTSVSADASWTPRGVAGTAALPRGTYPYGSFSGSDGNSGKIVFGPFSVDGAAFAIAVFAGPDSRGQSILLKDAANGATLGMLEPTSTDGWRWLRVQMPASARGRSLLLQGEDRGGAWGQWLGMTPPHALLP